MKRVLSITLVICMVFSTGTINVQAASSSITYVALGDSIGVGTGAVSGKGYTGQLRDYLKKQYSSVQGSNLSVDGMTSLQLAAAVTGNVPPEYKAMSDYMRQQITSADIITISIGGNDLLGPLIQNGLIVREDGLIIDMMGNVVVDPDEVTRNLYGSLIGILGGVFELNDDVTIYLNNLYSPFKYVEGYEDLPDKYIKNMNQAIGLAALNASIQSGGTGKCRIVDVYSNFAKYNNTSNPAVHTISQAELIQLRSMLATYEAGMALPPYLHPTDIGYKRIYNMHKNFVRVDIWAWRRNWFRYILWLIMHRFGG